MWRKYFGRLPLPIVLLSVLMALAVTPIPAGAVGNFNNAVIADRAEIYPNGFSGRECRVVGSTSTTTYLDLHSGVTWSWAKNLSR